MVVVTIVDVVALENIIYDTVLVVLTVLTTTILGIVG